jgi:protocatechuate 3,4-dioxygenase alpha subunit
MRGMLKHLATRIYFPDEAEVNEQDPILALVPSERRATLIPEAKGKVLEWNILLQGDNETVFFDY